MVTVDVSCFLIRVLSLVISINVHHSCFVSWWLLLVVYDAERLCVHVCAYCVLSQNCTRIYKYHMPSPNTTHTVHTRTAMEDMSFCTWPRSVFATSGHTAENGCTQSVEGARLQTYGTAQGTDFSHSTWTAKQQTVQGCQVSWVQ